jgi:hypothetical protein
MNLHDGLPAPKRRQEALIALEPRRLSKAHHRDLKPKLVVDKVCEILPVPPGLTNGRSHSPNDRVGATRHKELRPVITELWI